MIGHSSKLAIILLAIAAAVAASIDLPATSDIWTDAEKKDFRACVLRLSAEKGVSHQADRGVCEVGEEHKHWMRNHPEVAVRKENSARFRLCNRDNTAEMNGTPAQFHAAFDRCMREAYGLAASKQ